MWVYCQRQNVYKILQSFHWEQILWALFHCANQIFNIIWHTEGIWDILKEFAGVLWHIHSLIIHAVLEAKHLTWELSGSLYCTRYLCLHGWNESAKRTRHSWTVSRYYWARFRTCLRSFTLCNCILKYTYMYIIEILNKLFIRNITL